MALDPVLNAVWPLTLLYCRTWPSPALLPYMAQPLLYTLRN